MGESFFLTKELAQEAVEVVMPAIMNMMAQGKVNRRDLAIVILDPGVLFVAGQSRFDRAILYKHSIGNPSGWGDHYDDIAAGKAAVTWMTGLPSHMVQQLAPHLYSEGDVRHGGSANLMGIIVACSGVESFFDQMFAEMIASACRALCIRDFQAYTSRPGVPSFLNKASKP